MPAEPTNARASMPGRSHHSAPKFDGKPWSLKRFLNEIQDLAADKGLSEKHAISATISYAPSADYELWSSLASASGDKWDEFEAELCALYPGSKGDRKYNRGNLDALVREAARLPVTDHLQLGEYHRSFLTIATFLKGKKRISDQECSAKFLEGLHYLFRAEVAEYLRIKEPTHHTDDPWQLSTLYEAALFVLSNRNGGAEAPAPTMSSLEAAEKARVKTETFDASRIEHYLQSDVFMNKIKAMLAPAGPAGQSYATHAYPDARLQATAGRAGAPVHYNANMNGPPHVPPPVFAPAPTWEERPNTCIFCSDPNHFQSRCPDAADYIRRGLCVRDERSQIVLPNGMFLTRRLAPGNNLKERLDAWHAMNPQAGGAPVASTNFVDVSSTRLEYSGTGTIGGNPWAVFTHELAHGDDEEGHLTERERDEILILQNVAASAQRKISETRQRAASQFGPTTRTGKTYDTPSSTKPSARTRQIQRDIPPHVDLKGNGRSVHFEDNKGEDPAPVNAAPQRVLTKGDTPTTRSSKNPFISNAQPQFTYHTPIESPESVSDVVQQHLDATITITNRQLLAVAPEVRRALKDQIVTKRSTNTPAVAVQDTNTGDGAQRSSVETFLSSLVARTDEVIVANHLEDLRCITVKAPGAGDIEAIMDDGSQIIAMRADIWAKTGLPLRSDHLMVMESANRSKSDTKGLLQDFPVSIGEFTFYLQVQVVESASYEMLLGRPFMTLCQASTRHFSNGDSHLTIVDPNTQAVMTVPTHRRARAPEGKPEQLVVGVNSFF